MHVTYFHAHPHRWHLTWSILNPSCWIAEALKMQMCLRAAAACGTELLHDHTLMRLHKAHGLRGCRTCRHQPDTSTKLGLWRDQEHITCSFVGRPIPCVQQQARCSNLKLCALPRAAAGPSDPSPQQVVAIDVEFVHYTPDGAEPQSSAAYVCLVDRDLKVLLKSFINPGLPAGARLNGGVRLANIKGAPTLAAVGVQ